MSTKPASKPPVECKCHARRASQRLELPIRLHLNMIRSVHLVRGHRRCLFLRNNLSDDPDICVQQAFCERILVMVIIFVFPKEANPFELQWFNRQATKSHAQRQVCFLPVAGTPSGSPNGSPVCVPLPRSRIVTYSPSEVTMGNSLSKSGNTSRKKTSVHHHQRESHDEVCRPSKKTLQTRGSRYHVLL